MALREGAKSLVRPIERPPAARQGKTAPEANRSGADATDEWRWVGPGVDAPNRPPGYRKSDAWTWQPFRIGFRQERGD